MKPIQVFLGSGDPDDLDRLQEQYRRANGDAWDARKRVVVATAQPAFATQAATTIVAAANLNSAIRRQLGSRAASAQRERQRRHRSTDLTTATATARDKTRAVMGSL